jgi:cellobiose-specific phosphotransferase system component IIA
MMQITNVGLATASIVYLLLLVGSVSAQNITNQTMTGTNMTNATEAAAGGGLAKVKILEAIKSLESGDKSSALVELTAAQEAIAGESDQAKMHFNEGMKAFSAGDMNGALMHLKAADQALG